MRRIGWRRTCTVLVVALVTAACGGSVPSSSQTSAAKGPIAIWYSNNAEEVTWGEAVVAAWNKDHPSEQVTGQQIPAGKSSEEVIGAAITAGTTPCLIYNTAPGSVPGWQQQGGLVGLSNFSDGDSYINARTGSGAAQFKSPDGKFYQMPWKSNPVMIFYNKDVFQKAGIDSTNPPLKTYAEFLTTAQTLVAKGGVQAAIWPAPTSEYFQSWFDFYPLFIAQTGGKQLVENNQPAFDSSVGQAVANFWRQLYSSKLAPTEAAQGDAFATGQAAMAIVGPWAVAQYTGKVNWGVVPVPTEAGQDPSQIHTYSDEKSIGMYSSCKNQGTAWDFLKFSTSQANDGQLLQVTGQMPMRTDLASKYASYFSTHPAYTVFADQAARVTQVPNVPSSVEMWQDFRDAYSKAVIFGNQSVSQALTGAAAAIKTLLSK
ncbi:MAG TPA: extracellular solute-binding protein [Candidatus Dormibacteraeota bacterium]